MGEDPATQGGEGTVDPSSEGDPVVPGGVKPFAVRQSVGSLVTVEWKAILEGCRFEDMEG